MMYDRLTVAFVAALLVVSGGTAFALDTGAHGSVTSSGTVAAEATLQQQHPSLALVFADDYSPGTQFRVVNRLNQRAVDDVLGQTVDGRPVISDTGEYSGYVVHLHSAGNVTGEYGLVFVDREEGRLVAGNRYEFGAEATFFRTEINLLEVSITDVGGGPTPEAETPTPTPDEETPTPAEGTPTPETETPTPETETPTPEEGMPTTTPGEETRTPTPEPASGDANETTTAAEETTETVAAEETTTAAETEGDGGFLSGIVDFFSGLFGGDSEGETQGTTVDGNA